MHTLRLLLALLISSSACDREPPAPPPPPPGGGGGNNDSAKFENLTMKLVWRNRFDPDSTPRGNSMQPLVHEDKVVFHVTDNLNIKDILLRCYDATDGQVLWNWNDWDNAATPNDYMNQFVYQDYWLMDESGDMSIINLNTGQTLWQKENIDKRYYSQITDGYVYYSTDVHWSQSNQRTGLWRTPVLSFNPEKIIELRADTMGGLNHAIDASAIWQAPWGDEMAVFKVGGIDWSNNQEFWDFYVYNMDADSIYYRARDIAPHRRANKQYPVIDGHYAYLQTHRTLQCYDLINRKQVWQHNFTGDGFHHFTFPNLLVEGERVYIMGDDNSLFAFNKTNGELIWDREDPSGGMQSYMHYYKGVLYFTGYQGKLTAVRAGDGKVLTRMASYNGGRGFGGGLGISEKYNQLYLTDGWDVMAFEIPEKWHYE